MRVEYLNQKQDHKFMNTDQIYIDLENGYMLNIGTGVDNKIMIAIRDKNGPVRLMSEFADNFIKQLKGDK